MFPTLSLPWNLSPDMYPPSLTNSKNFVGFWSSRRFNKWACLPRSVLLVQGLVLKETAGSFMWNLCIYLLKKAALSGLPGRIPLGIYRVSVKCFLHSNNNNNPVPWQPTLPYPLPLHLPCPPLPFPRLLRVLGILHPSQHPQRHSRPG